MPIAYSVVIPVKDEENNIGELIEELEIVMNKQKKEWELICIEDGSSDNSLSILSKLKKKKPYLRIVAFEKNFGQSSAFDAGFKHAQGEFIITLDGDRQNDPKDIPNLLTFSNDYDLVCGWRIHRKDSWSKKIISHLANTVRSKLCQDSVHDTGCSLKIYRSSCLRKIKLYNGMHRFLPALFKMEGFRIKEVPVNHRKRLSGQSKYNLFNRFLSPLTDLFAIIWMRRRTLRYTIKKEIP